VRFESDDSGDAQDSRDAGSQHPESGLHDRGPKQADFLRDLGLEFSTMSDRTWLMSDSSFAIRSSTAISLSTGIAAFIESLPVSIALLTSRDGCSLSQKSSTGEWINAPICRNLSRAIEVI
jgi:hypothetical protein